MKTSKSDATIGKAGAGLLRTRVVAVGSRRGHVLYGSLLGVIASTPEPRLAHG